MTLEERIEQYKLLKQSKKAVEKRLLELRNDIIPYLEQPTHGLERQVRDLTSYDTYRVADLMVQKGIHPDKFTRLEIDPGAIENLYLEGELTDDDLRFIRKPRYTYALVEVGDKDVQTIDEGDSEGVRARALHD